MSEQPFDLDLIDHAVEQIQDVTWDLPPGTALRPVVHEANGEMSVAIVNENNVMAAMMSPDQARELWPGIDIDSLERIEL